jgi:putative Ca2+/H+ antiporter (TMEM165/GDT1 family)
MNLGVLFITMALIIPAELPDKTFISCIMMASRHKPLPVWIGGATALSLQALIAVLAGRLLELLPKTAVRGVVAGLFIAGALYLLFVPEKHEEERATEIADEEKATTDFKIALTTFAIVALAEFGDITQVLVANLTARYHAAMSVFVGATVGFVIVSGAGVLGGRAIVRVIPLAVVRRLSGLAMLGLGIYSIVELL